MTTHHIVARTSVIAGMLLLVGCRSPKTHFYALSAASEPGGGSSGPSLVVGPVELPRYLERNQIVARKGAHVIKVHDYHRWGGSLDREFLGVVGDSLGRTLKTDKVTLYPVESRDADYRVAFYVDQFEAVDGKEVVLRLRWTVLGGDGTLLKRERFQTRVAIDGKGMRGIVAAHSAAVEELSVRVAAAVRQVTATRAR